MTTNLVRLGFLAAFALASIPAFAQSVSAPAPFQRPTVSRTHVAFAFAGDIWTVERAGGEARRLTTDPGPESFPVFSPDSRWLAYAQHGPNRVRSLRLYSLDRRRQFTIADPRVAVQLALDELKRAPISPPKRPRFPAYQ